MDKKIKLMLEQIKNEKRDVLTYEESREVMKLAKIPLNKMKMARDLNECVNVAKEIGYPVVMKIVSQDVLHKTEAGGVKVGIKSGTELKNEYENMMKNIKKHFPDAQIEGVSIEEQVEGVEILVGQTTDPQFGKMIAFGIGGIFTEVYKDVSFRLIPITKQDVIEMYEEIEGKKMLEGFRGLPPLDLDELSDFLLKISDLIEFIPFIKEMDLNPVMITEEGLKAIDARIILET